MYLSPHASQHSWISYHFYKRKYFDSKHCISNPQQWLTSLLHAELFDSEFVLRAKKTCNKLNQYQYSLLYLLIMNFSDIRLNKIYWLMFEKKWNRPSDSSIVLWKCTLFFLFFYYHSTDKTFYKFVNRMDSNAKFILISI